MKELIGVNMLCYEEERVDDQESSMPGESSRTNDITIAGMELRTVYIDPSIIGSLTSVIEYGIEYLQVMVGVHEYYTTMSIKDFANIMGIKLVKTYIK